MEDEIIEHHDPAPAPEIIQAPVVPAVEKVTLRHPLTQDTKVVNATPEEMIPLMGRGYSQVKGA